ncbi:MULTISPECIES: cryptochrome/photolyase family protein [Streptomyces]|uniref:Deoxyribodipyrimidine photolyase n=1 Tax=Streptomyces viridochromogenes TaxID=1938 RepID=A0A0L8LDF0_STRVR|nr:MULTISPECIES: cryptochrome/photolyase family protein [Streptomyces]KOG36147.1 hypothetical protein ADK34_02955 [Streptomyces viridochromogenes]
MTDTHRLFGDQLGPSFLASSGGPARDAPVVRIESRAALRLVRSLDNVTVPPPRGFLVGPEEFAVWADGQRTLRTEGFYRQVRRAHDLLTEGGDPAGGTWNLDHENRRPPPRGARSLGAPAAYRPQEDAVPARCVATALRQVRDTGWTHHIPRPMVLGSYALQRGWDPAAVTDWFHRSFVDGYDRVMPPNVVGMSQYADGGRMTTKPYTSGGAYIDRMSDLCGPCPYHPDRRAGEDACPFTAGYWASLHRHRERLGRNARTSRPVRGLERLRDLPALLERKRARGGAPP